MRILPGRRQEPSAIEWPANTCERIKRMRSLGATWKIIGAAFDCDWQVVRNYYLSHAWRGDAAIPVTIRSKIILGKILKELTGAA